MQHVHPLSHQPDNDINEEAGSGRSLNGPSGRQHEARAVHHLAAAVVVETRTPGAVFVETTTTAAQLAAAYGAFGNIAAKVVELVQPHVAVATARRPRRERRLNLRWRPVQVVTDL